MSEETKLTEESSRGDQAKAILDHELVIEARSIITQSIHDKWEATSFKHASEREYLHQQLKAFNEVFRHFQSVLETGKMAKQTLKERYEKWTRTTQ